MKKIRVISIFFIFIILILISFLPSTSSLTIGSNILYFYPDHDSWVNQQYPNNNYGDSDTLNFQYDSRNTKNYWIYVMINLYMIDDAIQDNITDVTFYMNKYGESVLHTYEHLNMKNVSDKTWDEDSIIWNNKPAMSDILAIGCDGTIESGWANWTGSDLLNYTLYILNTDAIFSIGFDSLSGSLPSIKTIYYDSSEYEPLTQPPYLAVTYQASESIEISLDADLLLTLLALIFCIFFMVMGFKEAIFFIISGIAWIFSGMGIFMSYGDMFFILSVGVGMFLMILGVLKIGKYS